MRRLTAVLLILVLALVPAVVGAQGTARPGPLVFSSGLALQSAVINISSSGDNTVIAGTVNQVINIYGIEYFANAAVNITLKDGPSNTLLPVQNFAQGQAVIRDLRSNPWFTTSSSNGFVINLSAAQQVSGIVYYTKG